MAMVSIHRKSIYYHQRLFILFLAFVWLTVGGFIYYQYGRERSFRVELLHERLQLLNLQLLSSVKAGGNAAEFYKEHHSLLPNLRVTLIRKNGVVVYDSDSIQKTPAESHLLRPEVQGALHHGSDYEIRHSVSTGLDYFYSATSGSDMIARSAVVYTDSLANSMKPASGFLWLLVAISLVFSVLGYMMTRHLGDNIQRLRNFARKAGAGEVIDASEEYPHDELGEISNQIMKLYNKLLKTMDDRDKERQLAVYEAHEKIRIKRELTNNINHELKTPLSAIKGYLETILCYPDMERSQRELFTQKSYEQTLRLTELLRDVSTITKLEEVNLIVKKEHVNLTDIVDAIRQSLLLEPESRRMDFVTNINEPIWMDGDRNLLQSIFENLVSNALAYSSGSVIYVELRSKTADEYTFVVADDGVGVEESKLRFLFDRFYRVDKGRSRKLGGTGLGLSIVKNAVIRHGGSITVCNGERGGLEFTFTLKRKLGETDVEQ